MCAIIGPLNSGVDTLISLENDWGICGITRDQLYGPDARNATRALSAITHELNSFRCRRGFVLSRFPETEEEAVGLDKMLANSHPTKSNYHIFVLSNDHEMPASGSVSDRENEMLSY